MAAKNSTGSKTTTKRTTKRPPAATATTTTVESNGTHAVVETRTPSRDEIAHRAFELFVARGREHGRAQEDWLTAERELRARYAVS